MGMSSQLSCAVCKIFHVCEQLLQKEFCGKLLFDQHKKGGNREDELSMGLQRGETTG